MSFIVCFFYNLSSVSGGYFKALALLALLERGSMNEMMRRWSDAISDLSEPTPNIRVCHLSVYTELE